MTPELVQAVANVCVVVLLVAATVLAVGIAYAVTPGRDDGYRWMGDPAPPPERRSPFAPSRDDADADAE